MATKSETAFATGYFAIERLATSTPTSFSPRSKRLSRKGMLTAIASAAGITTWMSAMMYEYTLSQWSLIMLTLSAFTTACALAATYLQKGGKV